MTANSMPTNLTVPCFTNGGPLQIWVGTGTVTAGVAVMELLGWTRNGVEISENVIQVPLTSDLSGGNEGTPADFQYLGEVHSVVAELGQYSQTVLAKLARRVNASVTSRTKGLLIGCAAGQFRMVLLGVNFIRNYTKVYVTDPINMAPIGTAVTFPRVGFTCLEDPANTDSSPWNTTYTAGSAGNTGGIT